MNIEGKKRAILIDNLAAMGKDEFLRSIRHYLCVGERDRLCPFVSDNHLVGDCTGCPLCDHGKSLPYMQVIEANKSFAECLRIALGKE